MQNQFIHREMRTKAQSTPSSTGHICTKQWSFLLHYGTVMLLSIQGENGPQLMFLPYHWTKEHYCQQLLAKKHKKHTKKTKKPFSTNNNAKVWGGEEDLTRDTQMEGRLVKLEDSKPLIWFWWFFLKVSCTHTCIQWHKHDKHITAMLAP